MTLFDKICAVPTVLAGVALMILGGLGLFMGCNANFTLPPIFGGLPFLVGWAMCVCMIKYWRQSSRLKRMMRDQALANQYYRESQDGVLEYASLVDDKRNQ